MRYEHGVTLVELLTVIVVAAVLVMIAIPSLGGILATMDLNNAQENFSQALKSARALAMSRATFATVTVSPIARTATLHLADGSSADAVTAASSRVAINTTATYVFYPSGAASGAAAMVLSTPAHSSTGNRTITVTVTGQVYAVR